MVWLLALLSPLVLAVLAVGEYRAWQARARDTHRAEEYLKGVTYLAGLQAEVQTRIDTIIRALDLVEAVVKAQTREQAKTSTAVVAVAPAIEALRERFDERLNEIEEKKIPEQAQENARGFLSRIQEARAAMIQQEDATLAEFQNSAKALGHDPDLFPIIVRGGA